MQNENLKRDYDKNPIIIKDYNYIFWLLYQLWFIPIIVYIYIQNPGNLPEQHMSTNIFFVMPLMMIPSFRIYLKAKNKRTIKLLNDEVQFLHNNIIIESIQLSQITNIKKSYTDYYHKSQDLNPFQEIFTVIIFPFIIHAHFTLIINKFILKLKNKGNSSFKLFDSVIIFSDKSFINILPTTKKEYKDIEKYFFEKRKIKISKTKTFFQYSYFWEDIDLNLYTKS